MKLKERLAKQFADYPKIAIITYLTMSALTIIGFSIAIGSGAQPSSTSGILGVIGAGWLAAKATVPLRILATLAITPLIATLVRRMRRRKPAELEEDVEEAAQEAAAAADIKPEEA